MINVGVIGLGMMGQTHLDAYSKRDDVQILAISDKIPARLSGEEKAGGNVEGQAAGAADLSKVRRYAEGMQLIDDGDIDLVDICLPTPLHLQYAEAALQAGKHLLVEKPLARTAIDALKLVQASENATGIAMPAMCIRFWPGWAWLKKAIDKKTYGKTLAASFRRVGSHPGGAFYCDGKLSGGALLDLHVHDTDFVQYCFGVPQAVFSRGYSKVTGATDHVVTQYIYDDVPLVVAEGGWVMAEGFGFAMQYTVNFENATVTFEFDGQDRVKLIEPGKEPQMVDVGSGMGYDHEIAYLLDCIAKNRKPTTVTLADAARSVGIVEHEQRSIDTGQPVAVSL